jgi:uncharacterized membrane protein
LRKGYDYLMISFVASVITGFSAKIGASTIDKLLFILISYGLGASLAFAAHMPKIKKLNKTDKAKSIKFGIILGIVNFLAIFTALSALETGIGAIIFPILGINVAFIVVLSMVLFKERLDLRGIAGFILSIVAIILLS